MSVFTGYFNVLCNELGFNLPGFEKGIIYGAVGIIVIFIIVKLIIRGCRGRYRKSSGIETFGEKGQFFVSSQAISDLIKTLEPEFQCLTVAKTVLLKHRSRYNLRIVANLNGSNISFHNIVNLFQERVLASVSNSFGIESITSVDLILKRVK